MTNKKKWVKLADGHFNLNNVTAIKFGDRIGRNERRLVLYLGNNPTKVALIITEPQYRRLRSLLREC